LNIPVATSEASHNSARGKYSCAAWWLLLVCFLFTALEVLFCKFYANSCTGGVKGMLENKALQKLFQVQQLHLQSLLAPKGDHHR